MAKTLSEYFSIPAQIKSKLRLWVEYFLIAAVVALLAWASWGYTKRLALQAQVAQLDAKVQKAETRVAVVEEANKKQAEAIETIKSIREVDGTILAGLAKDMNALRVRDTSMTTRLNTLEKSNEAVRRYLNSAVPAPVGCLLDQTCPPDGDGLPRATERPSGKGNTPGAGPK